MHDIELAAILINLEGVCTFLETLEINHQSATFSPRKRMALEMGEHSLVLVTLANIQLHYHHQDIRHCNPRMPSIQPVMSTKHQLYSGMLSA